MLEYTILQDRGNIFLIGMIISYYRLMVKYFFSFSLFVVGISILYVNILKYRYRHI
jgi:uncharacterized membrane protein (Fun14 family)